LQRKNEAAQAVFLGMFVAREILYILDNSLPKNVKGYHSLVPLDMSRDIQGSIRRFGYPSWVYKAESSKFGKKYALRRLESTSCVNEI
jgi:PAB-dependent poly(A)-specific ribonuclease subunit 3